MRIHRCGFLRGVVCLGCAFCIARAVPAVCDQLVMKDGRTLEGTVVNTTRALLVIKLDSGETRPIARQEVAEYRRDHEEQTAGNEGDGFKADEVLFLPRGEYRGQLIHELARAQKTVSVIMYQMSVTFWDRDEPLKVADGLIEARKRGVDVRVLFEDPGSGFILDCNSEAAEYLAENGVKVKFDDPKRVTHTKLVIIDGTTSILGSHNWSASGLTRNSESSVLVRSRDVAAVFGRCFAEAWSRGNAVTGVLDRQRREAEKWQ